MTLYTLEDTVGQSAKIKVIGVGGGGGNAVNNMIDQNLRGVEFIVANTDAQAIVSSTAPIKIQLGANVTRGLGAGANPQVGKQAAEEERDRLRELLSDTDMVFITAGMGGGTGTGGAPVIAEVAHELGVLTVAIVTKPFSFEGRRRMRQAEAGIAELRKHVDTLITIPNQKLIGAVGMNTPMLEAFRKADDVLLQAVRGISELITKTGYINVDFADVKSVMSETQGMAMMGTGSATGENRAQEAAEKAISSPLLDDVDIHGARGLLVNVTGNHDMTLAEYHTAVSVIENMADEDANIICGMVTDESVGEEVKVTVVATGLKAEGWNNQPEIHAVGSRHHVDPRDAYSGGRHSTQVPPAPHSHRAPPPVQQPQQPQRPQQPPQVVRQPVREPVQVHRPLADNGYGNSDLDVPTWIRRQAD